MKALQPHLPYLRFGDVMKLTRALCVAFCSIVLVGCSLHESRPSEQARTSAATDKEKAVTIVVTPRSASWRLADAHYFDVIVKNRTPDVIKVPHIYDSFIEIDGKLYAQFPRPKLTGETKRVIQGNSDSTAGTVILNGPFSTVDARTGKLPLKLAIGEHELVLICGPHRSNTVTFELID